MLKLFRIRKNKDFIKKEKEKARERNDQVFDWLGI
jgi:hypothetical protein